MEDRGRKVSRHNSSVYMRVNGDGNFDWNSLFQFTRDNLERMTTFKYLGSIVGENGDLDADCKTVISVYLRLYMIE